MPASRQLIVHWYRKIAALPLWVQLIGVTLFSVACGAIVTAYGIHGWDDTYRYGHNLWLLDQYGIKEYTGTGSMYLHAYAAVPLELLMGIASEVLLSWLRDPYWIRHAMTFAFFPLTIFITYVCVQKAGYSRGTAVLCAAVLFGCIRFAGYALWNVKDVPFGAM